MFCITCVLYCLCTLSLDQCMRISVALLLGGQFVFLRDPHEKQKSLRRDRPKN